MIKLLKNPFWNFSSPQQNDQTSIFNDKKIKVHKIDIKLFRSRLLTTGSLD